MITGGLERAVYRIARKHAGDQESGWTCRVALLHEKTGSDSAPKEFNRMLRKIVESNELPEYDLSFTRTADGSPAVHFVRRTAAERAQIRAELEQEAASARQRESEDRRMREVDNHDEPTCASSERLTPHGESHTSYLKCEQRQVVTRYSSILHERRSGTGYRTPPDIRPRPALLIRAI